MGKKAEPHEPPRHGAAKASGPARPAAGPKAAAKPKAASAAQQGPSCSLGELLRTGASGRPAALTASARKEAEEAFEEIQPCRAADVLLFNAHSAAAGVYELYASCL